MNISSTLDRLHSEAKRNRWLRLFTIFNRVALAAGFFAAGMVKILGERFASGLAVNHPMGRYLEALHHTGYYYTFIGILQVLAALLLLIPRTAILGALLYFPIILNICILSLAVRFDGSLLSSPLMVMANLYLLCWDYDKLKYILPFKRTAAMPDRSPQILSNKFPVRFFTGVVATVAIVVLVVTNVYDVVPHNMSSDCEMQFKGTKRTKAGNDFCDCIHKQGKSLDSCLKVYWKTPDDIIAKQ